jgi:hypothetical protein
MTLPPRDVGSQTVGTVKPNSQSQQGRNCFRVAFPTVRCGRLNCEAWELFLDRVSTQCQNCQMNLRMQHPIVTFTGYAIALCASVYIGGVIGFSIELELREQGVAPFESAPPPDHVPSPKVFRGVG